MHKNNPCTVTALQNKIIRTIAWCPKCVAKFICYTAYLKADRGTIPSSSVPADTDMTALCAREGPVLLPLQSCRIRQLWLYNHAGYDGCTANSTAMQGAMTVLLALVKQFMTVLLVLWSSKIQWMCCWLYSHVRQDDCAAGSTTGMQKTMYCWLYSHAGYKDCVVTGSMFASHHTDTKEILLPK